MRARMRGSSGEPPSTFTVPADGPDVYQAFVIPIPVEQLKWVKGFEFRPGNRKIVHHAVLEHRGGAERQQEDLGVVDPVDLIAGLPLLDLPVGVVCPAHGVPADRAALERALCRSA